MARDRAIEKARFCLATGIQPSEYEELTLLERDAFVEEVNKQRRR